MAISKTLKKFLDEKKVKYEAKRHKEVYMKKLKSAVGATGDIKIATEAEFKGLFPDCDPGAMPPFGMLYKLNTVVDKSLADDEKIAFNAGSHKEIIKMRFADFKALEQPRISAFAFNPDVK
jgi:Ala-tRNA(Pro) deacylase